VSVDRRVFAPLVVIVTLAIAGERGYASGNSFPEPPRGSAAQRGMPLLDPRDARPLRLEAIAAAETDSVVVPANAYAGIAFGGVNSSVPVGAVLEELGKVDKSMWRLGHYDPLSGGYSEAAAGLSTIDRGLGYWLITKNGAVVTYLGTTAPDDSFDVTLSRTSTGQPAWNQVGNPFKYRISAANLSVVKRDSIYVLQQINNPFTQTQVKVWNPGTGAYANGSTLTASTAFWARVTDKNSADQWTIWNDPMHCPGCLSNGWKPISMATSGDTTCVFYTTAGGSMIGLVRYAPSRPFFYFFVDNMNGDIEKISMQLDASRYAHMAYAGKYSWPGVSWTTQGLLYWHWDGSKWVGVVVDSSYSAGAYAAIRLDATGHPRIAFNGDDYNHMKYAFQSGANWTVEIIDTRWSYELDLALDRTSTPHVTYVGTDPVNFNPVLRYGTRLANGTWATEDVDPNGVYFGGVAIGMDAQDKPHIVYTGSTGEVLYSTRQSPSNWTSEVVGSGTAGRRASLSYDPQGNPHIAYWSSVDHHLRHAVKSGGTWTVEVVDQSTDAGSTGANLTVDRAGHPHIGYFGGTNQDSIRIADKLPGTLRLRIPNIAIPAPAGIAGWSKPNGASWALSVEMEQGTRTSEALVVGAASLRASDLERLRSSSAPPPPGDYLSLGMMLRDENGAAAEYVSDFQAPAPEMRWEFTARGLVVPGEARLSFSSIDMAPGTRLWLTDVDHGWTREVDVARPEPIAALAGERHFVLTATAPGTTPATVAGLPLGFRGAYPNPFAGSVGLRFGLAAPTHLSVEVIDITGRVVRRIDDPATLAGERVLVWDGRDQSGRPLRAGVYLARYRIGSEQGVSRLVKLQ